ncbi:MAG: DUF6465 family protein [Butyrivibrio sp.]|nr:DUF6465 family protein [Butyrivibrio sp.]
MATIKTNIVLQYGSEQATREELIQKAKDTYLSATGKKASDIKSLDLYVKPEENKVYYVVNNNETGDYNL